jgi:glycosyltransferase involved in cell wall biosynthesis
MRILILNYEFPPLGGGGGIACFHLARELAKKNQIDWLTTGFKKWPKYEPVDGIHVRRVLAFGRRDLSSGTYLSMLLFIIPSLIKGLNLCRKNKYDLIWSWFAVPSGITGIIISKIFCIPHALTIIGGDIYDPSKKWSPHRVFIFRKVNEIVINNSNIITSVSNDVKEKATKHYDLHVPIKPIPIGFVRPTFKRVERKELKLSNEDIILISIGRLVKRKGYEYAIVAVSKLPNQNVKYLIIGSGPEEENLRKLIGDLNVNDKVELLGFVSDEMKFQYLFNSDIYVLSSLHEGFGICLLEAMYCGLAIVSTDQGGQTDFLAAGRNALYVPIKDYNALTNKIYELIENKKKLLDMSKANREDMKKYYIENIAQLYEDAFKDIIQEAKEFSKNG